MVGNGHAYCITGWSYNINLGLDKDCINSKQLINHGPMVADSGRDLVLGSVCMRHLWDSFMLVGERTCTGLSGFTPALSGHSVTMQDWPNLGKPEAVKSDKPIRVYSFLRFSRLVSAITVGALLLVVCMTPIRSTLPPHAWSASSNPPATPPSIVESTSFRLRETLPLVCEPGRGNSTFSVL